MRGWRGPSGRSRPHASVAAAFGQVPEHPAYLGVGGDAGLGISASSARTSPLSTGLCPRDLTDAAFSALTEPSRRPPRPVSPPAGSRRRHRLPASGRTRRARTRLRAGRPRCAPGSPYVPPRASRPRRVSARIHLPRTGRPPGPPRRPSRRASSACLPRWRRRAHHREARSGSPRRRLSRRRRRSPRPAHGPTIRHQPSPYRPPAVRQRATGSPGASSRSWASESPPARWSLAPVGSPFWGCPRLRSSSQQRSQRSRRKRRPPGEPRGGPCGRGSRPRASGARRPRRRCRGRGGRVRLRAASPPRRRPSSRRRS